VAALDEPGATQDHDGAGGAERDAAVRVKASA